MATDMTQGALGSAIDWRHQEFDKAAAAKTEGQIMTPEQMDELKAYIDEKLQPVLDFITEMRGQQPETDEEIAAVDDQIKSDNQQNAPFTDDVYKGGPDEYKPAD